ncbi:hypothetical protein AgCh_010473 [Apium graveolens]
MMVVKGEELDAEEVDAEELEVDREEIDSEWVDMEGTCSMLIHKYVSLSGEFTALQSQQSQLQASFDMRVTEIAQLQADKRQTYLQSIEKDGVIERLNKEASEFHKSKRQLLELLE